MPKPGKINKRRGRVVIWLSGLTVLLVVQGALVAYAAPQDPEAGEPPQCFECHPAKMEAWDMSQTCPVGRRGNLRELPRFLRGRSSGQTATCCWTRIPVSARPATRIRMDSGSLAPMPSRACNALAVTRCTRSNCA